MQTVKGSWHSFRQEMQSTPGILKTMGRSLNAVTSALQEVLIVIRILSYR